MASKNSTSRPLVVETRNEISRLLERFRLENALPSNHPFAGLNTAEFSVVMLVGDRGPQKMSGLAARLILPLTTTTSVVDRLVDKELAGRRASEDDRRIVLIELQPKGRAVHALAVKTQLAHTKSLLQCLPAADQKKFLSYLCQMQNN